MRILLAVAGLGFALAAQEPAPAPPVVGPLVPPVATNSAGETVLSPRIRQITKLHNTMPHYLVGVGLVTGISNGASDRGTRLAMLNLVRQLGLNLAIQDVIGATTTLVTVTCTLPPFAKEGQTLDVQVQSITDTTSLRGGVLQRCELKGVDGQTWVVAEGSLTVAGYQAKGTNAQVDKNPSPTASRMNGGLVIRTPEASHYSESGALELRLTNPSPFNAMSVANGVRTALDGSSASVSVVDMSLVRIELPEAERTEENALRLLAFVGNVRVAVENPAKVMIDQVSGTVLAGEGVLISPCVVGSSELTIAIVNEEEVVQPNPWALGTTERVGRSRVEVTQNDSELRQLTGAATVADLLQNLKALGMTPAQLVSVFEQLDKGGFLHAELEVR